MECGSCGSTFRSGATFCPQCGVGATGAWFIIGREEPADIKINAPQVSGTHAKARNISSGRIEIQDLSSSNGTFVNGQRISGITQAGSTDKVNLGSYQLHPPLLQGMFFPMVTQPKPDYSGMQNIYNPSVDNGQNDYSYRQPDYNYSASPEPQPVIREKGPMPGRPYQPPPQQNVGAEQFTDAAVRAVHETKSYVGSAVLAMVLYYVGFYIVGLVLNFIYLSQASTTQKIIGRSPSGHGCLWVLLVFHFILPMFGLFIVLIFGTAVIGSFINF